MLQVKEQEQGEIALGLDYLDKEEICKDFWSRLMSSSRRVYKI